ncbi:MAG TPA: RimK family protein [Gammaproteobacteria bacterium]|nr:RimK family protein [Gammaproteobacteria bacterium]
MAEPLILMPDADRPGGDWPRLAMIEPSDYLSRRGAATNHASLVVNLASSYRYLSIGYYSSLLAEARGERVIPSVRTIEDLSRKTIYGLATANFSRFVTRLMRGQSGTDRLRFYSYFGFSPIAGGGELCRQLFERFPAPILRIELGCDKTWRIERLTLVSYQRLPAAEHENFLEGFRRFLGRRWRRSPHAASRYRYDLAVLHDPEEKLPPSDRRALGRLTRAGRRMKVNVELVTRRDYPRIAEYDALFIRETTAINHHSFAFATRAWDEGIPVIDDPDSILRCTNKVYLAELLAKHRIAHPRTLIVSEETLAAAGDELGFPLVLKMPDGSFSRGVFKADDAEALLRIGAELLEDSELVLAQEFLYTPFDWRIGVLAGEPLYACKYFMARKHWQIYDHSGKRTREGDWETVAIEAAPPEVVDTARRAARLIGGGLYGVDIKELPKRTVVIEINDNPNLDADVEDACLGDELYERLIAEFIRRIEQPAEALPRRQDPA